MRDKIRRAGAAVDGWTRKHWLAGGGSVLGWTAAVVVVLLIITWGVTSVGLPQNPASELGPLATQVALPQSKDPNDALEPKDRLALQRDLAEYVADSRVKTWTLLAQVIGAVVLAIGGYFTWRNLHVAQEGQITNRFTQAIDQLGAELKDGQSNLEIRLGGIYALERIARDSPRDYWTIMEILTAYVRQHAAWRAPSDDATEEITMGSPMWQAPSLPADIQAVLTVIGRRALTSDRQESLLDLSQTDLRGADLHGAHLDKMLLFKTHLESANLMGTHFEGAHLVTTFLNYSSLFDAHFAGAELIGAHLFGVDLEKANLKGARLLSVFGLTSKQISAARDKGASILNTDPWEPGQPAFEAHRAELPKS